MVRPKKKDSDVRLRRITIRTTDEEYRTIEGFADKAKLPCSTYIREMALEGQIKVIQHCTLDPESLWALNRLGSLLNQLVKQMHIHGEFHPAVLELCRKLDDLIARSVE